MHRHQQQQRHQFAAILCLMAMLLGITACTDDQLISNAYKTLKVSADTYDGTMKAVADLYSRGVVDDQLRNRTIDIGTKFKIAHQAGAIALAAYATAIDSKDKAAADGGKIKLDAALAAMSQALGELTALVGPLLPTAN